MRFSLLLLASGMAAHAAAIPGIGSLPALVSKSYQDSKDCHCNVSKVAQPKSNIPPPNSGLQPIMIAIGRGTQNYSCPAIANATAAPTALGALAKLYDFSCVATKVSPDQLGNMTAGFESLPRNNPIIQSLPAVGMHFFSDSTTPTFALYNGLGTTKLKKTNATNAPATAQNAVPWLKLDAIPGQSTPIKEVYRLDTANGNAPATCGNMTGNFQVEYAAEYWFYAPANFTW